MEKKKMRHRKEAVVKVWHGARGGGKTLSMVFEAIRQMIIGEKVWSNFPISGRYQHRPGSVIIPFESVPFNVDQILGQDGEVRDGIICWDEMPLWIYSRSSTSVINRLFSLDITLLRKKNLSLFVTAQFIGMLDKSVRMQTDLQILCTDLSYKYHQLERGSSIGWLIQDMSGKATGDPFAYNPIFHRLTFYGRPFWNCYDTENEFDIFDAATKYKMAPDTKVIVNGEVVEGSRGYKYKENDSNIVVVKHTIAELQAGNNVEIAPVEFWRLAKNRGFDGTQYMGEKYLEKLGIEMLGAKGRPLYDLSNALMGENE